MRRTLMLLTLARMCTAWQISAFEGTWVLKSEGQAILKLTLAQERGRITGSLTKPSKLTIDPDSDVTDIGPDQVTLPVRKASWQSGRLELKIDDDRFVMTTEGHDRATLELPGWGMRPWRLERASDANAVILAVKLPELEYPQEIRALDEARMEAADAKDRPLAGKNAAHDYWLLRIFDRYGWVTI